jgi:ABC-type oligopeptide transport system ATPase subunit
MIWPTKKENTMVDLSKFLTKKATEAKPGALDNTTAKERFFASFQSHKEAAKTEKDMGILHGTGITKRVATRQESKLEKAFQPPIAKQVAETQKSNPFTKLLKQQEAAVPAPTLPEQAKIEAPPVISLPTPSNITLDDSQKAAVEGIMREQYACLIGAAGTGKTTVTKVIIEAIEHQIPTIDLNEARTKTANDERREPEYNVAICFCAFTGRAVQQMKRAIPKRYHPMCNTVHATLGYHPETYYNEETEKESMRFIPAFDQFNKLPYMVYVIDETGMLPIELWDRLWDAMPRNARVIMIGDINQLPPVQGRSVLGFAMTRWPTFELTTIHRQALDNPIIMNAHKVLQGHIPQKVPGKFDMIELNGGSTQAFNAAIGAVQVLHKKGQFDPLNDALIVPQNKGDIGQLLLNEKLVTYFNPVVEKDGIKLNPRTLIRTGMTVVAYAQGDKVMLLQNDRERGLTNGMTGIITQIAANGAYQGTYGKQSDKNATLDMESFDLTALKQEAENEAEEAGAKEEENKRQASHVVTVRFGQPTAKYLELKRKIDFLNGVLELPISGGKDLAALRGTEFAALKNTHDILQAIAGLEMQAQKEDSGQEIEFRTAGQYNKITHAYAFTCHKSQGGEYPTVIILVHSANIKMLNREWLYTAVTRARERVVLIFNNRGLLQGLNLQRVKGRTLAEKVAAFNALQDQKDVSVPNLPAPRKWKPIEE